MKTLISNLTQKPTEIKFDEFVPHKGNPLVVGQGFVLEKDIEIINAEIKRHLQEQWFVVQSYAHAARQKQAIFERLKKAKQALDPA